MSGLDIVQSPVTSDWEYCDVSGSFLTSAHWRAKLGRRVRRVELQGR